MIRTVLTLDSSQFKSGLKQAKQTAQSTLNSVSQGSKVAQNAINAIGQSAASMSRTAGSAVSSFTKTLSSMGPVGLAVAGVFAGVALAIGGAYKGLTSLSERLDRVAKDAKSIGMSFNGMLATKFAAGRAGNDFNRTIDNIQKLTTAWEKATKGEEKYIKMFKELGVDLSKDWLEAPERLYGSVTSALASGKSSSALTDLLGRRGMREASKSAKNGFEQDLSLAATLGLEVNEGAAAAAERLMTAQGQLSDGFMAMLAKVQLLTGGMDALAKIEERLLASTNAGKPLQEGVGYENIYNILENNLDEAIAQYLAPYQLGTTQEEKLKNARYIVSKDSEETKRGYLASMKSSDVARIASIFDSRIKVDDQSTWVQKVEDTRTEAEKAQANAYAEALFHIRGGAQLEEELNHLKQKQIDLTKEQIDTLEDEVRSLRQTRWENTFAQVSKDRRTLNDEQIKQMLGIEGFNENALKYIESTANALLGEHGLTQLFNRHGGTSESFINAYQRGSLFTPYAEDVLSEQTRNLMSKNNLSLDTAGLEEAKKFVREQEELSKSYAADKAAKEAEIAATKEKIATLKQEIAETDKKIASNAGAINIAEDFGKSAKRFADTLNAFNSEFLPDWMVPEAPEPEELTSDQRAKLKEMQSESLHKSIELEARESLLREQQAAAQEYDKSSKEMAKSAEDMAKAAAEMRKYVEFNNIDKAIQKLLEEAEAIDFGKMLNAQVESRKAAQGQYAIDNAAFSSRGNGKQIAEAQAVAMMEAAGLTVTESSLKQLTDDIYKAQNEQRQVGIQRTMQSQFYANEDFAMSQFGPRGAGMKAVADAVRQFGDALSEEQKSLIRKICRAESDVWTE